ncbi:MAG TPA: hypothetical protein VIG97_05580, partial [Luteimonas sp.]
APRKRRRRRGGRRVEGEARPGQDGQPQARPDGNSGPRAPRPPREPRSTKQDAPQASAHQAAQPATPPAPKASPRSHDASPSLLGRIGQGLRRLVKRAPRSQH